MKISTAARSPPVAEPEPPTSPWVSMGGGFHPDSAQPSAPAPMLTFTQLKQMTVADRLHALQQELDRGATSRIADLLWMLCQLQEELGVDEIEEDSTIVSTALVDRLLPLAASPQVEPRCRELAWRFLQVFAIAGSVFNTALWYSVAYAGLNASYLVECGLVEAAVDILSNTVNPIMQYRVCLTLKNCICGNGTELYLLYCHEMMLQQIACQSCSVVMAPPTR